MIIYIYTQYIMVNNNKDKNGSLKLIEFRSFLKYNQTVNHMAECFKVRNTYSIHFGKRRRNYSNETKYDIES